jgi:hypothetical protein
VGGFISAFKQIITGDPLKGISSLIEEFHLSPEQKAQLQQAADQLALQREQIAAARDQAIADIQGQNIRAETTSPDAYVRRARPTFLYAMILAMVFALVIAPTVSAVAGHGYQVVQIPDAYLQLFGVGFLGYTGARTWEKVKGVNGS